MILHRIQHPRRSSRRAIAVSGVALAVASLVGVGRPAAANEFAPAPVATFAQSCDPKGNIQITLSNTAGLSDAHFSVNAKYGSSGGGNNIDVAPGATFVLPISYGDHTYSVTVTADGGYTNSAVLEVDCTKTSATLLLVCHGEQPVIEADATTTGPATTLHFSVDGTEVGKSDTGSGTFSQPILNGAAYTAALTTGADGPIVDIAGIADCPPATIPETTIPGTTIPEVVVTIPEGVPQATVPTLEQVTTSLPSAALPSPPPPSAPMTLPATGTSNAGIAAIGAALVGLGLLLRRATRRPMGC